MSASEDLLLDLGVRPSAGMNHWGASVRTQLKRVREARDELLSDSRRSADHNARQINGEDVGPLPEAEHPEADHRLHMDTHFLVIAMRNVLRDHDAITKRMESSDRLVKVKAEFMKTAPSVTDFRNFYEHLDEYIAGTGNAQKSGEIEGPASPQLHLSWTRDVLGVRFGSLHLDVIKAAEAAAKLADDTFDIWHTAIRKQQSEQPSGEGENLSITMSVSTVISE